MSSMEDQLRIADLERRLNQLEFYLRRDRGPFLDDRDYWHLYKECVLIHSTDIRPEQRLELIGTLVQVSARGLLQLAEDTGDPMPWLPMLQLAISLREATPEPMIILAEANMRSVARALLDAQGFKDVDVEECLASPRSYLMDVVGRMTMARVRR